jgi:AraC-like DNA-binding protein
MTLAKDLLAQHTPLKHVAEAIGYQSASAFSTAFRRQFGHAPGYKRKLAKSSR